MQTIILVFITLTLLAVLYFNIAYSNNLRRKLEAEKTKNADLRCRLADHMAQNALLSARLEARECHRIMLREDQADKLKECLAAEKRRSAKLEKMLMQKWRESKNADVQK